MRSSLCVLFFLFFCDFWVLLMGALCILDVSSASRTHLKAVCICILMNSYGKIRQEHTIHDGEVNDLTYGCGFTVVSQR